MLKMRFLGWSGQKYEKSCLYGHGVFLTAREECVSNVCKLRKIAKKREKMQKSRINAKNRGKKRKNAKKCEKSRKKLVKSGKLWGDRQVMGWQVMGGCTVKSTARGRNRVFKGVEKMG